MQMEAMGGRGIMVSLGSPLHSLALSLPSFSCLAVTEKSRIAQWSEDKKELN
jgi:hypothetical protein